MLSTAVTPIIHGGHHKRNSNQHIMAQHYYNKKQQRQQQRTRQHIINIMIVHTLTFASTRPGHLNIRRASTVPLSPTRRRRASGSTRAPGPPRDRSTAPRSCSWAVRVRSVVRKQGWRCGEGRCRQSMPMHVGRRERFSFSISPEAARR